MTGTAHGDSEHPSPDRAHGNSVWHGRLEHIPANAVSGDTRQTSGMRRFEAISGKTVGSQKIWMGQTHVGPSTNSGDHHHGEAETAIYVVSGHPSFVFADGDEEIRIDTGPGDYIFVPPYVPHREENPSPDEEAVVVIGRSTQEGIVVNLPSLWSTEGVPADAACESGAAEDAAGTDGAAEGEAR
ncbi:cupin domain-containing protein [Nocardiopsis composta]|uniref:Putative RmlC-like cupin family protein n=1 Tax=Nocardiopsis composta TaxID=157465 RepID=A0A7W8QJ14_9ACTN|nr:cupin domain-containing protein [Nocardiopsis composta]MBB5431311.1 putative RmlC-like cupin family protein [Nocardiopsis composta]